MQNCASDAIDLETGDHQIQSPDRPRLNGPIVPLSPTAPTTTTSTSSMSHSAPFPFQQTSSPTVSPQPPLTRTQRTDEARTAFTAALRSAGSYLDSELQARARDLHANAEQLERQNQGLREQTQAIREENDTLEEQIREQRQGLLDLHVQTRSEAIGADREIEGVLHPDPEGEAGLRNSDGIESLKITSLGDITDLDQFLKGMEQEVLVLEETCRIVEGEYMDNEQEDCLDDSFNSAHEAGVAPDPEEGQDIVPLEADAAGKVTPKDERMDTSKQSLGPPEADAKRIPRQSEEMEANRPQIIDGTDSDKGQQKLGAVFKELKTDPHPPPSPRDPALEDEVGVTSHQTPKSETAEVSS